MPSPRRVSSAPGRPVVVFDGECGFCRFWIARWRDRTDDLVEYTPFQDSEIPRRFPEISRERCARAMQLVEPDGRLSEGGEAVWRLLAATGLRVPLWAYERIPGVAWISERGYRLVADHRPLFGRITKWLWGDARRPSTYALGSWLFLRLLGLVYLIAFWSLADQILGLVGHDGVLPARLYMDGARSLDLGLDRFRLLPTLTWLSTSDAFLRALCVGGAALASMVIVGIAPLVALPLMWIAYLTLSIVCREFLSYQWDALLLEAGFLAIFIAPRTIRHRLREAVDPPRLAVWLFLWLVFRLMEGSGAVKLASGDPTWRGLTALSFHFETQPIPTPVAWYAHRLPLWFLKVSTAGVLATELLVPWLILGPRRVRSFACLLLVGLQALIAATGNYAFFNLLTAALCVFLLDDAALEKVLRVGVVVTHVRRSKARGLRYALLVAVAVVTVPVSAVAFAGSIGIELPGWPLVAPVAGLIAPFRSVNSYGLFAVMTTTRPEIIVEGSDDGTTWKEYEFKYKAGDLRRRPPWVAPHQPRLDWQMWFAALGRFEDEPWFQSFCARLLQGDPTVLGLLERDPFEGRRPRYLRAILYQYHFSDAATRRSDGVWWTRERLRDYSPVLSLSGPA